MRKRTWLHKYSYFLGLFLLRCFQLLVIFVALGLASCNHMLTGQAIASDQATILGKRWVPKAQHAAYAKNLAEKMNSLQWLVAVQRTKLAQVFTVSVANSNLTISNHGLIR